MITCSHDIFSIQCTGWKCMEKHQGCRTNMNLTFKCLPLQSETLPLAQPFKNYINYIMAQFPGYTKQAKFLLWPAQSDKSIQSRRAQVNLSPGQVQTEELTQSKFLIPTQPGDPSSRVSFVPAPLQTPFLWYGAKVHPTSMGCGRWWEQSQPGEQQGQPGGHPSYQSTHRIQRNAFLRYKTCFSPGD